MNRWGSYDDYAREIDELAERQAHDESQCEGLPLCSYCLDEWEQSNQEEWERQRNAANERQAKK